MNIKTLLIMGLVNMFGLGGCANAQIGKQVLNLDDLDYGIDVVAIMLRLWKRAKTL